MQHTDLEELNKQTEYWKTKISQIENENIQFKTRLMEILKMSIPRSQLEAIEYFQTHFIQLDEHITLLRHEVREQQQAIARRLPDNAPTGDSLRVTQQLLENKLLILHKNFAKLQREFVMYLRQWH